MVSFGERGSNVGVAYSKDNCDAAASGTKRAFYRLAYREEETGCMSSCVRACFDGECPLP